MSTPPKEDPPLCVPGGAQFQPLLYYVHLTLQHSKSRSTDLCPIRSGKENKLHFPSSPVFNRQSLGTLFPYGNSPRCSCAGTGVACDTLIWKSNVENFFPPLQWKRPKVSWVGAGVACKTLIWKTNLSTFSLITAEVESWSLIWLKKKRRGGRLPSVRQAILYPSVKKSNSNAKLWWLLLLLVNLIFSHFVRACVCVSQGTYDQMLVLCSNCFICNFPSLYSLMWNEVWWNAAVFQFSIVCVWHGRHLNRHLSSLALL